MPTRIVNHAEIEDVADDISHPIPALGVVDVTVIKSGGGADLHIVIAKPIQGDVSSQQRLLDKIAGYLGFIGSVEFRAEAGEPSPPNTHVIVQIHPESSLAVFDLLERCKPWVQESRATLVVKLLDQSIQ